MEHLVYLNVRNILNIFDRNEYFENNRRYHYDANKKKNINLDTFQCLFNYENFIKDRLECFRDQTS